MYLFYARARPDGLIRLDAEESRHAIQVLRRRPGDTLQVVDGQGHWYETTIQEADRSATLLRIEEQRFVGPRAASRLHLAVAPPKNSARLEWLLEKATEIGVDRLTPLVCRRSERRRVRPDRLRRVLRAAMKQSLRAWLPELQPMLPLMDFLDQHRPTAGQGFIAHLGPGTKGHLKDNYHPEQDVTILIGPEGGFAPDEIEAATRAGFTGVTLGESRLRTETAALLACTIVNLKQT